MTKEEYIQYLRLVVHTTQLDMMTTADLSKMKGTYSRAIWNLINNVFKEGFEGGGKVRAEKLLREFRAGLDAVSIAATNDVAYIATNAANLSQDAMNNIVSWDGRVEDFAYLDYSLAEMRETVLHDNVGGKDLQGWIDNIFADSKDSIIAEINAGRIAGDGYPAIADKIRGKLKAKAIDKNGRRLNPEHELETITRTYVQTANVNAQSQVYAQNTDIVDKVLWVSTLENGNVKTGRGTCPRCAALDGQIFEMDSAGQPKNGPDCPLHPRCRCVLSPQTKTWDELGFDVEELEQVYRPWVERTEEAIALGGRRDILEVGQGLDYKDLFFSRGTAFQNNVVGPVRAEMIRQKYVNFEDIIDNKGNMIPIRDLRKKNDIPGTGSGPINKGNDNGSKENT